MQVIKQFKRPGNYYHKCQDGGSSWVRSRDNQRDTQGLQEMAELQLLAWKEFHETALELFIELYIYISCTFHAHLYFMHFYAVFHRKICFLKDS